MIALFDMDGTLADFDGHLAISMNKLRSPDEPTYVPCHDDNEPAHIQARRKLIQTHPGWWLDMPILAKGFTILSKVSEMGYEVHVLTKGPKTKSIAWSEKLLWCQKHLGEDTSVNIVGKTKALTYGRILVDDFPGYIEEWLNHRPRGLVIMPAHPYNAEFRHPNVVRFDGTNLDEVVTRLKDNRAEFLSRNPGSVGMSEELPITKREKLKSASHSLFLYVENFDWYRSVGQGLTKEDNDLHLLLYVKKNRKKVEQMFKEGWEGFPVVVRKMGELRLAKA